MPENSGRVDIQSWNAPRMPRKSGSPHRHPDRVRSFTIGRSHRPEGPACHNVIDMVQLSHLALAWASDPSRPDWPNATILVDGVDPFAGRMAGFDPGDIFGDDRPLLPDRVGRRVAVVRCTCGEAGCGVAAPEIRMSSEGVVSWTDFRTYTGVFIGPTTEYELGGGRSLEYPNMYFDAGAYAAEVERATRDRTWETPRRVTARLVHQAMSAIVPFRWQLGWVSPAWQSDGFTISLTDRFAGRGQVLLHLSSPESDPEAAASDIIAQLSATPSMHWGSRFA